mmetsp:Transcript_24977/g.50822  ORF Transcript_24977/g.50822 Transcript_24977/m.50822 type:complete len:233 (-) Transcript_24977:369-1067(-)
MAMTVAVAEVARWGRCSAASRAARARRRGDGKAEAGQAAVARRGIASEGEWRRRRGGRLRSRTPTPTKEDPKRRRRRRRRSRPRKRPRGRSGLWHPSPKLHSIPRSSSPTIPSGPPPTRITSEGDFPDSTVPCGTSSGRGAGDVGGTPKPARAFATSVPPTPPPAAGREKRRADPTASPSTPPLSLSPRGGRTPPMSWAVRRRTSCFRSNRDGSPSDCPARSNFTAGGTTAS